MQTQEPNQSVTTNETEKKFSPDKCVGIYGLRNKLNNKWYIGQSIDIEDRWRKYKNLGCKFQRKLYNALLKYGYENFETKILEICENNQSVLDRKEDEYIIKYDSIKNGYNIRLGGSHGKLSQEQKNLLSEIAKKNLTQERLTTLKNNLQLARKILVVKGRKPHTEETKNKMRLSSTGKKHTEETKQKIRLARIRQEAEKTSTGKS